MSEALDRNQLVTLVERISQAQGTEEEIEQWLSLVDRNVPAPSGYVSDLIFWPDQHGFSQEPSPSEIIDKALSYRTIRL